jgi:hypothetical protein
MLFGNVPRNEVLILAIAAKGIPKLEACSNQGGTEPGCKLSRFDPSKEA